MNIERIINAQAKAKRFNTLANEYRQAKAKEAELGYTGSRCPKESGALKRASMDLTRSLSSMRNGK